MLLALAFPQAVFTQQNVLFVAAGQSNAVGQGSADSAVRVQAGTAFEFRYRSRSLVPLADPVGEDALGFQQAHTGSAWPAFAKTYHELSGKTVLIVPAARGGSSNHQKAELRSMGTWAAKGEMPLLDSALLKIKQAQKQANAPLKGIIWLQGERDANAIFDQTLSPAEYEEALKEVIRRFREGLNEQVPFYIVLTGNQHGREPLGNEAVRHAQKAVAGTIPGVYIVYEDAKNFSARKRMKDFVHYDQAALNDIGAAVARRITRINPEKR